VLGERAYYWGRGGRWADAARDDRAAWELSHDPQYALGQVEALLHDGQPAPALARLQELGTATLDARAATYGALLGWIAARRGAPLELDVAAETLAASYARVPAGERVFDEPDPDLAALACAGGPCVLDVFTAPRMDASLPLLRKRVAAAK
jgi:hypothetical protein